MTKEKWEEKELGKICDFVRGPFGGSLKKSIFKKTGYAIYEQQHAIYNKFNEIRYFIDEDKFNEMKRFELNSGDLIMSCSGTMGKIAIVPKNIKKGIINQALLKLSPSEKILNTFLKFWIESNHFQNKLGLYSQGGTIQNVVSVKTLKKIRIPVPPLSTQKKIVSILERAKKLKEKRKQTNELTKQLPQSLFLEMFGDPNNSPYPVKNLNDVCEKITDGSHTTPKLLSEGFPFLTVANMREHDFEYKGCKRISKADYEKLVKNGCKPSKGDVLFSKDGTVGKVMEITKEKEEVLLSSIAILRPNKKLILSTFLAEYLKSDYAFNQAVDKKSGSAIRRIILKDIKTIKIPLPSLEEQRTFVEKIKKAYLIRGNQSIATREIDNLLDSLMQKAFKGELVSE